MAVKRINYFSNCLHRRVDYLVALPNAFASVKEDEQVDGSGLKVLVLLHGLCEMGVDYLEKTAIEEYADKYNLCVILPSGENSFYLDGKPSHRKYGTYVGEEILKNARERFHLTDKKEDTFIGGSSMGGFGAIRTGLFFRENFGGIFGMSSALIMDMVASAQAAPAHGIANQEYYDLMFGPSEEYLTSKNDPRVLVKEILANGEVFPKIYLTCGTSDFMLQENRSFDAFLTEQKVTHTYVEDEGGHDFNFWSAQLEPAIRAMLGL